MEDTMRKQMLIKFNAVQQEVDYFFLNSVKCWAGNSMGIFLNYFLTAIWDKLRSGILDINFGNNDMNLLPTKIVCMAFLKKFI